MIITNCIYIGKFKKCVIFLIWQSYDLVYIYYPIAIIASKFKQSLSLYFWQNFEIAT